MTQVPEAKVDKSELEKLGALVKELSVSYSFKAWAEGKTVGGECGLTVQLGPDADPELVSLALFSWAKAQTHVGIGDELKDLTAPKPKQAAVPAQAELPIQGGLEPPAEAEDDDEQKPGTFHKKEIVKFSLEKRTDGKFHLKLFPIIGGGPGKFAHVHYVAERDRMWDMLEPVGVADYDLTDLPKEYAVEWIVNYQISEKKTTKGGYYKDLIKIELAH